MKWIKDNPFLAGLAVFTAVAAAALGFLVVQARGACQEAVDGYTQAVQKLHGLQNRSPFPSAENLKKSLDISKQYAAELDALRSKLLSVEAPIDPSIKPQGFQDGLRAAVNDITDKATKAGVALPADFYLGFSQYQNSLPTEAAAPGLARELALVKQIVSRLIDFKVRSIDSLNRSPLPEEAGSVRVRYPGPGGRPAEADTSGLLRYPFDLAFTAEQGKFRVMLNSLLTADQFLLLRSLSIQNTNPVGPEVAADASATANPGAAAALGTTPPATLNVLLGREALKVNARIEIIDFIEPPKPDISKGGE